MQTKVDGYELIGFFNTFENRLKDLPSNGSGTRSQNKEVQSAADTLRRVSKVEFSSIEKTDQIEFLKQLESVKAYLSRTGTDLFKHSFLGFTGSQAAKSSVDRMLAHITQLCIPLKKEIDLDQKAKHLERLRLCDAEDAAELVQKFEPYREDEKFLLEAAKILLSEFPDVFIEHLAFFPLKNPNHVFLLGSLLNEDNRNRLAKHFGIATLRMNSEVEKFAKEHATLEQAVQFDGICYGVTMSYCSPDPSKRNLETARFIQNVYSVQVHQYNESYHERNPLHAVHMPLPAPVRKFLKLEREEHVTSCWKPLEEFDETLRKIKETGGQFAVKLDHPATQTKHAIYLNFDKPSFCDPGECLSSSYQPILNEYKDAEELTYEFRRHLKLVLSDLWNESHSRFSICRIPAKQPIKS